MREAVVEGIGIDIIEIARIRETMDAYGDSFLHHVFTPGEIAYCNAKQNAVQHFTARFASKEAVGKALATGWAGAFRWKDVEVQNNPQGKPEVVLHGDLGKKLSNMRILLSISHSHSHVVAVAVIQNR